MAKLKILTDENPRLYLKSREITEVNGRIKTLLDDMVETMHEANGVGLAAPQVGVLRRCVVVETTPGEIYKLVNPVIIESSGEQVGKEGCLSVPNRDGTVTRPNYVKVKALNENGEEIIVEGTELLARCLCHELDHLDGILYTKKASQIFEYDDEGNIISTEDKAN